MTAEHQNLKDNPDTLRTSPLRERARVRLLARYLNVFPRNEKTLDIGCGWGMSLQINPNFYLIDGDAQAIAYLKSRGANARLVDVSKGIPFEDEFFDNAFSHDVLEHLEEEEMLALFREARRVIRRGGLFMNVVPNQRGFVSGLNPEVGHKRFVQLAEIQRAARESGFQLEKAWFAPLPHVVSELFTHNKLVTVSRAV